jgi:PAS domain S-box-containing protein
MKTSHTGSESKTPAVALRRRAEGIAGGEAFRIPEDMESLSIEAARQMLHELRVHQIELEMQNEELRRAQAELDAARARYYDLYDLAPVGYCTLGEQGLILEANLTAPTLLGVARSALVKQPLTRFILPEDQDVYYRHRMLLFETGAPQACELRLVKKDGAQFWAHITAAAVQDGESGAPVCRVVMSDITERKFRDDERDLTARLIVLINTPGDLREHMSNLTASLQGWSGCEAIGIRLRDKDDYPYYETRGFPPTFVQAENHLCAYDPDGKILRDSKGNPVLECMCGNILCGRFDPAKPFFTAHGSFWSNNTTVLLASSTKADRRACTRNRCNGEGYESVALIPLRTDDQVFGLLQFNDHRPDRFTPGLIAHFERMADNLAIALSRRQAVEALRETRDYLDSLIGYANAPIMTWDTGSRITLFNHAFERLTGYTAEEVMDQELFILFPETSRDESLNKIKRASLGEYWESVDLPIRCKDGVTRIVIWNSANIYAQDGKTILTTVAQGQDITERKNTEEKLIDTIESLRKAVGATIQFMVSAVESRDPYTAGHQVRSAGLARAIATEMGLPQNTIEGILIAGSIHDIGKLSIPAEILSKPTKLSDIEFKLIKEHARQGYEILKNVESPWTLAEIVYQHHERMDGSGYPRNLKGDDILIEARILAVADVVEAMASHRPYRPGLGIDVALNEIEKNRGTLYDSTVADACLKLFREKGFQLAGN